MDGGARRLVVRATGQLVQITCSTNLRQGDRSAGGSRNDVVGALLPDESLTEPSHTLAAHAQGVALLHARGLPIFFASPAPMPEVTVSPFAITTQSRVLSKFGLCRIILVGVFYPQF
jgi:hypothetical protein